MVCLEEDVFGLAMSRRLVKKTLTYLQSKQGDPIPDSMGTKRPSLYAVLGQVNIYGKI